MSSVRPPRPRFVPTLTEVVQPAAAMPVDPPQAQAQVLAAPESVASRSSMLEAAVDGLMPQAREQMRQKLHAAAYALAEEELQAMEESLRQQLRTALREAAGMGTRA